MKLNPGDLVRIVANNASPASPVYKELESIQGQIFEVDRVGDFIGLKNLWFGLRRSEIELVYEI